MSNALIDHRPRKVRLLLRTALALCMLMGSAIALLAEAAPASATTLSVCQWGCNYNQLAPALAAAHDGDTIAVGLGTYLGGITIDKSVNLVGEGAGRTTINGGGPVVTIGSKTSTPTVTLSNLTITGGISTTDPQSPNCGPDLVTCGPGYTTATGLGGGVESFPGTTVTIRHSVVTDNEAVPQVSVTSVVATCALGMPCQSSQGAGGGIDDWGTMTLIGSVVTHNGVKGDQADGGGITVELSGSLSVQASAVTGNSATAPSPDGRFAAGSAIFVAGGGSLDVDGSVIDDNTTSLANSIATPYPAQEGNTDQESAYGGVFLATGSTTMIRNSELDGNSVRVNTPLGQAYGSDAALCACGGPLSLQDVRIEGNNLSVNALTDVANGPSGPGILEADSNATYTGVQVVGNRMTMTSPTGGAGLIGAVGFLGGAVPVTITDSTIADNRSTVDASGGTATIQGVGVTNDSDLTLSDVIVLGNKGVANGEDGSSQGGGIWNGSIFGLPTPSLSLDNSLVVGNALSGTPAITLQGAGIYTEGSPTTLTNSLVAHNTPDQCFGC
jgi:fibronectin-binding autotransporter adhesin